MDGVCKAICTDSTDCADDEFCNLDDGSLDGGCEQYIAAATAAADKPLSELEKIGPLSMLFHGVSGVIYTIDLKRIKIVNFTYDGFGPETFFHVGTALPVLVDGSIGTLVPYPGNSTSEILTAHDGSDNVIITLPGSLKTTDIKWLSVWCRLARRECRASFGDVEFPDVLDLQEGSCFLRINLKYLFVGPLTLYNT